MGINVEELKDKMSLLDLEDAFYIQGDFYGLSELQDYNYDDRISHFYRVNILAPGKTGEFDILKLKISADEEGVFSADDQEMIQFLSKLKTKTPVFCQVQMAAYKSGERAEKSYRLKKICGVG